MTDSTLTRVPLDLQLTDPDGHSVTFGDKLTAELTVVQLVRYFGCLPCQEWLVELDQAVPGLGAGGMAVGGSADYQAQWLRDERGVTLPLLLDPTHAIRQAVGAQKPIGVGLLAPRGAAAYARSLRKGYRPQKITRDTIRTPGVVVVDGAGEVRWSYVGTRIGDYPSLDDVRTALAAL